MWYRANGQMRSSLIERVREFAERTPTTVAIRLGDTALTYGALHRQVLELADRLRADGVQPGHRVGVVCGDTPAFAVAYLGVQGADAVPVIAAKELVGPMSEGRWQPAGVICLAEHAPALAEGSGLCVWGLGVDSQSLEILHLGASPQGRPGAPRGGHILFTSGSSGAAKAIAWSPQRLQSLGEGKWLDCGATTGLLSPLAHAAGLHHLLSVLGRGRTLAIIERPYVTGSLIEQLERFEVASFKCMPPHVELLMTRGVRLPACVKRVQVSGAPISAQQLQAFARTIAPAKVRKVYGLAEVGALCILKPDDIERFAHTVGRPRADRRIEIWDPDGKPVPVGETGEVVVLLDNVPAGDGYVDPTPELIERFTPSRLMTRDRGHFDAAGYLVLSERTEELIKVSGKLVSAPKIEALLREALPGAQVAVARVPDRSRGEAPVLVFTSTHGPASEHEWRALCQRALADVEVPRGFLPIRQLPVTPTGKLAREALSRAATAYFAGFTTTEAIGTKLRPSMALSSGESIVHLGVGLVAPSDRRGLHLALLDAHGAAVGDAALYFSDSDHPLIYLRSHPGVGPSFLEPFLRPLVTLGECLPGAAAPALVLAESHLLDVPGAVTGKTLAMFSPLVSIAATLPDPMTWIAAIERELGR